MQEDKSKLVRKIFSSEVFREADEAGKEEIIQQVVNTGEISKEEAYISYLESLPYDVFVNVIFAGDIKGKDLIYLCNSSSKLREYCNRDLILANGKIINQYLFRRLLDAFNLTKMAKLRNPRELYKELTVNRLQDHNDLVSLLAGIYTIDGKNDFTLPNILKLLYQFEGYRFTALLSNLKIDPNNPQYDKLEWLRLILENSFRITDSYKIDYILATNWNVNDDYMNIKDFSQIHGVSIEKMIQKISGKLIYN